MASLKGIPVRNVLRKLQYSNKSSLSSSYLLVSKENRIFGTKYYSNQSSISHYDVAIIGGGIVGMATARQLIYNHPNLTFSVLEKENVLAPHQSSNNSGVIHAGIYYQPGSLRAKLCVKGLKMAYAYCDQNNVPYKKCGKLIVATNPEELGRLDGIYQRGLENEVPDLKMISSEEIRDIEPHCVGLKAIHSPHTGIVDWGVVTKSYGENFLKLGGKTHMNFKVTEIKESENPEHPVLICGHNKHTNQTEQVLAKYVIACGGLYSDTLAELSGCDSLPKIVPFRGEYLLLKPEKQHLVKGNIYPVPDPKFPFLGVHCTPRMNGDIWLGPNAVLAFRREGYKLTDFNLREFIDAVKFPGLRKLVLKNLNYALGEFYRGIRISQQVKQLQRFVPEIQVSDVVRGPAGVRAQALGADGSIIEDFVFDVGKTGIGKRTLHVRNAPSPAATSSLAIAEMVAEKAEKLFDLR